ncbi:MAG: hypothetical protein ACK5CE_14850, partial [Actinomycetes bacterium]
MALALDIRFLGRFLWWGWALPGRVGLVMALDETGYVGDPTARQSQILPGWNAAKIRRMGASAAKLLV